MSRLVVVLVLVAAIGCASPTNEPAPPPTPNPSLSVGSTLQDVRQALLLWKDFVESHPTCSDIVTQRCITQEERFTVATALRAYAATRSGPRLSTDTEQDSPEAIRASRDLVVAIANVMERAR